MFRFTIDDLLDLRSKLLAAVITESLKHDAAEQARQIADMLQSLAVSIEREGECFISPHSGAVADVLQIFVADKQGAATVNDDQ
jgi:hypothetical protein